MSDCIIDVKQIRKILPHRYPFLLVDKITEIDLDNRTIVGQKNVSINEGFFQGHFPEIPIMPGVLILESMAQTGGILIHQLGYREKMALFLSVKQAKFRRPVKPGDIMMLHVELGACSARAGRVRAKAIINGKVSVEAELGFALVDKDQI